MSCHKILIITSEFPPQPGGIGNHAFNLANQLSLFGYEILVLADNRSGGGEEEKVFDARQPFRVKRFDRYRFLPFTYVSRIYAALKQAPKADRIILSGKFSLWTGGLLSLFWKDKCMAVVHGSEINLPGKIKRRFTAGCLKRMNKVVAVSSYTASLLEQQGVEARVIPNGFTLSAAKGFKEKGVPVSGKIELITVGNMTTRKGQHNVINALPRLKDHFSEIHYHVVGLPTRRSELEDLASRTGVSQMVHFHGRVSESRKIELLQKADIFVMLSERTEWGDVEGFGIAVLEANSLGLPAVGSSGSGVEDAIDSGSSGMIVDAKDIDQICSAVNLIAKEYEAFSKGAINWSAQFSWEKIIPLYLKIIEGQ